MSQPRRVPTDSPELRLAGTGPDAADNDTVGRWFEVLERLLRLPSRESAAIREELESHVRERVRDLVMTGTDETEAVQRAISELGDAAVVAQRYREARSYPKRRMAMNLAVFAAAGFAAVVGVITISQPADNVRISVFTPPAHTTGEHESLSRKITVDYTDVELFQVMDHVSTSIGMPINVMWKSLVANEGVEMQEQVSLKGSFADFPAFLTALGEQLVMAPEWLDFRVVDGVVKVATQEYFDRGEMTLASYELKDGNAELTAHVIQQFVHPEGWMDNGGNVARIQLVGNNKMFVRAPKRYHAELRWFIDELSVKPKADEKAAAKEEVRALQAQLDDLRQQLELKEKAALLQPANFDLPEPISVEDVKKMDLREAQRQCLARNAAGGRATTSIDKNRLAKEARLCYDRVTALGGNPEE